MSDMDPIYEHVENGLRQAVNGSGERRIGAELKFPLVNHDGTAAGFETICALWDYLQQCGWQADVDSLTGSVVGARKPGPQNDTVASCETGYCKTEFSLAHVADLFELEQAIQELRDELRPFADQHQVHFLGYGIQPVTPPSQRLLMKKSRTSVWDKIFASNRHIPPEDGDDMHLFTINAASHVHVSVSLEEAIPAVNVLNGFTGAQIALTAHSNVWRGRVDPHYKCVAEKFWDWWMPDSNRVGMPQKPFSGLKDYVHTIARLRPVYVKRDGQPIVLDRHRTFAEYFSSGEPIGTSLDGAEVPLSPNGDDIDLHSTCYWYNARLSRYHTVENRVNDQQPPDELVSVAALTLGLVSALDEASEELASYNWQDLRAARESACRDALDGRVNGIDLADLAGRMLAIARAGLERRGLGEQRLLEPLERRCHERRCPADESARMVQSGGIEALVAARRL